MEVEPLIAWIAGAGIFVIAFWGGYGFGVVRCRAKENAERQKRKKQISKQVDNYLHADPNYEAFDVRVTRMDIDNSAFFSLESHVSDLVSDLREYQQIKHRFRLSVIGYDVEDKQLVNVPDVRNHFLEVQRRSPELPIFLEKQNLTWYVRFLLHAHNIEETLSDTAETSAIALLEQEILKQASGWANRALSKSRGLADEVVKTFSSDLAEVCSAIQSSSDGVKSGDSGKDRRKGDRRRGGDRRAHRESEQSGLGSIHQVGIL